MKVIEKKLVFLVCFFMFVIEGFAEKCELYDEIPAQGSISEKQGHEYWAKIYEVFSHPRCTNCHVGADNIPMWSGPSYGVTRPHGMNVSAPVIGAHGTRGGSDSFECSSCHTTTNNTIAHGAPGVYNEDMDGEKVSWVLPPVDFEWFGKTSKEVCEQVKDSKRNGGKENAKEIADHLCHDKFIAWSWKPGAGRESAPYSLKENIADVLAWGAAGMPCPEY